MAEWSESGGTCWCTHEGFDLEVQGANLGGVHGLPRTSRALWKVAAAARKGTIDAVSARGTIQGGADDLDAVVDQAMTLAVVTAEAFAAQRTVVHTIRGVELEDVEPEPSREWVPPTARAQTYVLVACSGAKAPRRTKAIKLYKGSLFAIRAEWADKLHHGIDWILSAEHGLLDPLEEIEPYDKTLAAMSKEERAQWGGRVGARMLEVTEPGDRVIVLAGKHYLEVWPGMLSSRGRTVERKAYRGVGYERQALIREINEHAEARAAKHPEPRAKARAKDEQLGLLAGVA